MSMNYLHWFIPFACLIAFFIWYFGKTFINFFPLKTKIQKKAAWSTLAIFSTITILFRTPVTGFLIYFTFFHLIYDFLLFCTNHLKKEKKFLRKLNLHEILIISLALLITCYGIINTQNLVITTYTVHTEKKITTPIKIGFISDIHLGTPYINHQLETLKTIINNQNYDVFILGGDILDEWSTPKDHENLLTILSNIKTKYGLYYIEGNHDPLTTESKTFYEKANVTILEDEAILINNQFYLIGRKDRINKDAQSLSTLTKELNEEYPIILLEHRPTIKSELENSIIDISLSGHTHGGQIWPANYFLEYGHYQYGNKDAIVSSGYGEWGVPIRTAHHSEIITVWLQN